MTGAPCYIATYLSRTAISFDVTVEKGNESWSFIGDRSIMGYQDDRLTCRIEAVEGIDDVTTVCGI
jgi:hypothetical protein